MVDPDIKHKDAEIDDEVGIAAVVDEEKQEDDDDESFKIQEDSDDGDDGDEANKNIIKAPKDANEGNQLIIGGDVPSSSKGKAKVDKDIVSPHQINGFWVQRQVSKVYPDPVTTANKVSSVLSIISSESKPLRL